MREAENYGTLYSYKYHEMVVYRELLINPAKSPTVQMMGIG